MVFMFSFQFSIQYSLVEGKGKSRLSLFTSGLRIVQASAIPDATYYEGVRRFPS